MKWSLARARPAATVHPARPAGVVPGALAVACLAVLALAPPVAAADLPPFPGAGLGDCATPHRTAAAATVPIFDPSDCSEFATNPSPDYDPGPTYEIPVVVHVIMDSTCTQGVLDDERIEGQIEVLNEDFLALPGTPGAPGTDTRIRFVLASEDAEGQPTSGITRDCNTTWYHDQGDYWLSLAWDPHRYLNLYTNDANGARGYVPHLPAEDGGIHVGQPYDRVVINWLAIGRDGPVPTHSMGRTASHEFGHYLGLRHVFFNTGACPAGTPPDCYADGDLLCDTPPQTTVSDGCPEDQTSCGSPDAVDNYMDYSDDDCLDHFTAEQMRRLRCTLTSYRPLLYREVVEGPQLAFSPPAHDFGPQPVGVPSPPVTFTLSNAGKEDALALDLTIEGPGFAIVATTCGASLPAGGSCTVDVHFAPLTPGPAAATLAAASGAATADAELSGQGLPAAPQFLPQGLRVDATAAAVPH